MAPMDAHHLGVPTSRPSNNVVCLLTFTSYHHDVKHGYFEPWLFRNLHYKVISEHFQSHFSEYICADDIEVIFCLDLYIYMDKSLVAFWKSFLVLLRFFG